ncbi:hypothetical protein [Parenemella sanctibonifatiensis]|nr:hypothetical protein [Parenemella sanctibonifatiensis]
MSRRDLAAQLGHPDDFGRIPEARWSRAMLFERLVQQQPSAARFVTQALGAAGFDRPSGVVSIDPSRRHEDDLSAIKRSARLLREAHDRAVGEGAATLVHTIAVPFPGLPPESTAIKPDFAIVAPSGDGGSSLLMGDVKDYERVRSRIDDGRMLKGFLQVALGAYAVDLWDELPRGMVVSEFGVLAVPRNSFLQPTPVIERLRDHRAEVVDRLAERIAEFETVQQLDDAAAHARHLEAKFDPTGCASCPLYACCRAEIRQSSAPDALLIELGVPTAQRAALVEAASGGAAPADASASVVANVRATQTGTALPTGQRRTDPIGQPGTINVVVAKSDGGSLGVHGIALRPDSADWDVRVFADPLAPTARHGVLRALGAHLDRAMAQVGEDPVHIVVPDLTTADLLVSIADSVAGVELRRIRWQHDLDQGRQPLTFEGEPATVPDELHPHARLAASFLLEADRSRALRLRSAIVDVRGTLSTLVVAGGPRRDSLRLDYLLGWAETLSGDPLDHREFADQIEAHEYTAGARLTSRNSDAILAAQPAAKKGQNAAYEELVRAELAYKQDVVDRTLDFLATMPTSGVREAHRVIEKDAQTVWRRRLAMQASDLVRFGRVSDYWRNIQVQQIDADDTSSDQLAALGSPQAALDKALDPGNRHLLVGDVVTLEPLTVRVNSRRLKDGESVVLLHVGDVALVDQTGVTIQPQAGGFKFDGVPVADVAAVADQPRVFELSFVTKPGVEIAEGGRLVLARYDYFGTYKNRKGLKVNRPGADDNASPKKDCTPDSYADDPDTHQWCCRPHAAYEAERSDAEAEERELGLRNPQVWPPALDEDGFDVAGAGEPTVDSVTGPIPPMPTDLSLSDLD